MKKRVYALIPCLLILVLLAVFAGIRLKQQGNSSQTEYSIAIEDSTSTGSERPVTSSESRTSASKLTDSGTTTARTTASDAESTSKSAKTKRTKATSDTTAATTASASIDKNGSYTSKEDVALYIHTYGKLPSNFITKKQAQALGWSGGSLEPYAPGKSIGGSPFGNYEGSLPSKKGRQYTECDIDTKGKSSRGAKRIVFSNDGLIYYTGDHYKTFELLYGEE